MFIRVKFSIVIFGLVGLALISRAQADDWLHCRGPAQTGISNETGLVKKWKLSDALWVDKETGGRATPIVLNDRVYLNCRTRDDVNDPVEKIDSRQQVVCWDAKSGKVLWRDVFNVFLTDVAAPRVGWSSMCGDKETGYVYTYTVDSQMRCYDGKTGKIVWQHSMLEKFGAISGYGGRTQSPIIDEDQVIISTLAANWGLYKGPAPKQYFFSFDKKTGALNWVSGPGANPIDTNQSVPFVMVVNGQRLLVAGNSNGAIYAINARTGKPVWEFRMSKRGINATATHDGKHIYVSHGQDNVDNESFGRVQCIDPTGKGDVTKTHSVWRRDGLRADFSGLLVKDGVLHVLADTGDLHAFDSASGKPLWVQNLGTVGKSSAVWADGHVFITEVNGNIYTLKTSKEKCEVVNHVHLDGLQVEGADEIYASPAISNGRMFYASRDRMICVGTANDLDKPTAKPTWPKESATGADIDTVQLRPYEVTLREGQSQSYELLAFDKNGRLIKKVAAPKLMIGDGLNPVSANGNSISIGKAEKDFAGLVMAELDGKKAMARVRVMPSAGYWKWDFEGFKPPVQVPPTWVRAHIKMKPKMLDGNTVMRMGPGKGRPSHMTWIGTEEMKNYVIQSDVYMTEQKRKLATVGITNQRYNFVLDGNNGELQIRTWQPHLRMAKTIDFDAEPDKWYVLKLIVDVADGRATVRGKVWERGTEEPAEWTLEAEDPHANLSGAPGVYVYGLADCYFDNIVVEPRK